VKYLALLLLLPGCTTFGEKLANCTTNGECTDRLGAAAVCVQSEAPTCVALASDDCAVITGDYQDDTAVVIASLLSTTGAQKDTNTPRQQAAIMAVEEINASNASGGILQSATPGDTRKLVMVSCDEAANLPRAATHLISELHVAAIVGPNLSQDVLDLTTGDSTIGLPSSAQSGTALLTPTGVASAIATVPDNGLTFMMTPSDIQRVPLMTQQINAVETQLKAQRGKSTVKLAIYYRDDALGKGTRDGLTQLTINSTTLATAITAGTAREDSYDPASTNNAAQVSSYVQFRPDIIVLVGAAESVKSFVVPLEAAWPTTAARPYYIAIDSTKVPDLITAVTGNDDLRQRFRGTGISAEAGETQKVFDAFQIAFGQRWKDASGNPQPATQSGMGPTYDAVYTIALALVGKPDTSAQSMVSGMPSLSNNTAACNSDASGVLAPCFTVSDYSRTLYNNMGLLLQNKKVTEIGTFGRLEWDAQGAKSSGLIEMWCIKNTGATPEFDSSGLFYDVKTQQQSGSYTPCAPGPVQP
jgi:ABC-type branched-subunit amino acid transport system substrate-binding protein